jgi:hypothetical protein
LRGTTLEQTAVVLGVGRASVSRLQARLGRQVWTDHTTLAVPRHNSDQSVGSFVGSSHFNEGFFLFKTVYYFNSSIPSSATI